MADGQSRRRSDWPAVRLAGGHTGRRRDSPAVRLAGGQTRRRSDWPVVKESPAVRLASRAVIVFSGCPVVCLSVTRLVNMIF